MKMFLKLNKNIRNRFPVKFCIDTGATGPLSCENSKNTLFTLLFEGLSRSKKKHCYVFDMLIPKNQQTMCAKKFYNPDSVVSADITIRLPQGNGAHRRFPDRMVSEYQRMMVPGVHIILTRQKNVSVAAL